MRPKRTILFSFQLLTNVGCEIIIRGSIAFLTRAFPNHDLDFIVSSYDPDRDRAILADLPNIRVVPTIGWKRYIRGLLIKTGLDLRFWTPRFAAQHFRDADLFVSVGGDIYTMFGDKLPRDWLGYEHFATRHGIPCIMFGANMERFEILNQSDQSRLITHLQRFHVIALRDKATKTYLANYGVSNNTVVFPDPMFSLRPRCTYHQGRIKTIGLNVSPILWRDFGNSVFAHLSQIVSDLVARAYKIALLPHVYATDGNSALDDRNALRKLFDGLPTEAAEVTTLYDGPVSFADLTREISSVDLFIGARMHSCLNAVTLGKPTLFLSYSSKAHTMVDWLQNGPMAHLSDRIRCAAADTVTISDILELIAAQDSNADAQDAAIDFMSTMVQSPVWEMLSELDQT